MFRLEDAAAAARGVTSVLVIVAAALTIFPVFLIWVLLDDLDMEDRPWRE